jgi:hypothetical protein
LYECLLSQPHKELTPDLFKEKIKELIFSRIKPEDVKRMNKQVKQSKHKIKAVVEEVKNNAIEFNQTPAGNINNIPLELTKYIQYKIDSYSSGVERKELSTLINYAKFKRMMEKYTREVLNGREIKLN